MKIKGKKTKEGTYIFSLSVFGRDIKEESWEEETFPDYLIFWKEGDTKILKPGWKGSKNEIEPKNPENRKLFEKADKSCPTITYVEFENIGDEKYLIGHWRASSRHKHQVVVDLTGAITTGILIVPEEMIGFIIGKNGSTIKKLSVIAGKKLTVKSCEECKKEVYKN